MQYSQAIFTYLLTYLLTYSLTHLLTYSLTHLLTYSLTHLLTYSLTHLLTYLLTYLLTDLLRFHCFIALLNSPKTLLLLHFIWCDLHIFGSRNLILFVSLITVKIPFNTKKGFENETFTFIFIC